MKPEVLAELRHAFGPHPDLIRRPKEEQEAIFERFAAAWAEADDGFGALCDCVRALPARLGLAPETLTAVELVELPPPAVFLRTTSPLLGALVDACGSGSYTRRQHPWLLLACFADPDFEPPTDFPYYLRPRREDWRQDKAGCRMDAWRLAFGLWLYGEARGRPQG